MTPVVVTYLDGVTPAAAAVEPVTLAEAKAHLRILHSSEDAEIGGFVAAARSQLEDTLGRAIVRQTLDWSLASFPASGEIALPRSPLLSVTSVKYLDTAGAEQTLSAAAYHALADDKFSRIERASGASWPAIAAHPRAVTVRWVAGYTPAACPPAIKQAILLMVAHWYSNREAAGDARSEMPLAVKYLTDPHKVHGWI